jgi:uncharacterized protein (DUF58 family)
MNEGDFYGLREWRSGDARNRIHWRTTARRQALTVRQYERRHDVSLQLIVEFWEPAKPAPADRARTESVASFVATVVAEACRDGGRMIGLQIIAKRPRRFEGAASAALLLEIRQALAAVEPTPSDQLPAAVVGLAAVERPQSNVIVVSTRAVDLEDVDRFAELHRRPELHALSARYQQLWPSNTQWSHIFREPEA